VVPPSRARTQSDGDPIPEVFPPGDPTARFVVAMSTATDDLDRACRDLLASVDEDRQDFTYRLRLICWSPR
jgi:hypothetical protein